VDGFVAHVASFRTIEVMDIRNLDNRIPNVVFRQCDFMAPLPAEFVQCCDFGLGRYGDPVACDGHLRGLDNLRSLLEPEGRLYVSVPIGPQRLEFDAQRVFSLGHLVDLLKSRFVIESFSFVDDAGDLHENEPLTPDSIRSNAGCLHGCAIFEAIGR
jgi:SAM-dependent methyltransferase